MTLARVLIALLFLAPALAEGQPLPITSGVTVANEIAAGESRTYALTATAGDLVTGAFGLGGADGRLELLDDAGTSVGSTALQMARAERAFGFVIARAGSYHVRITNDSPRAATSTIRAEILTVAERMRGVHVRADDAVLSPRIRQLAADVSRDGASAVSSFWKERAGTGPLIEEGSDSSRDVLVTFLWREIYETHNVLVAWPLAGFRADDYYMTRLPGTDVWFKSLQVRRGSRFTYTFSPNDRPEHRGWTGFERDPLNARVEPEPPAVAIWSVLEAPDALDESWFRRTPARRGRVDRRRIASALLQREQSISVYTPPGYARDRGPYPLVVLFDGAAYVDEHEGLKATTTLDNLVNDGRIRPPVVCFVEERGRAEDVYGDSIARELVPLLRSTYALSAEPEDTIIGGYSAGASAAAAIALRHPGVFGNVLAQSGAFRGRAPGADEPNRLAAEYLEAPRVPVRFYIETGLYDNAPNARLPLHEMILDETNTAGNRHFRDVLRAKGYDVTYREWPAAHEFIHWRAALADAIMTLLAP